MDGIKRLLIILSGLAVVLALLISCASSNEVKIGAEDNGGKVEMNKGQTLVVALESNPTTGYAWEVMEVDASLLQLQGEAEYNQGNTGDKQSVGAGGSETLRFLAVGTGETPLKLVYRRSWEMDVEPVQTLSLQVTVH